MPVNMNWLNFPLIVRNNRKKNLKHISVSHIHDYKSVGSQQHPALQGVKENSLRLKSIQILTSNMGE